MLVSFVLTRIVFFILQVKSFLLILHVDLMSLINQFLFTLNILEHIVALRDSNVIGEYLRVVVVELEHPWQPLMGFLDVVKPLQVFGEVIEDEILLEHRNDVTLLIVHNV